MYFTHKYLIYILILLAFVLFNSAILADTNEIIISETNKESQLAEEDYKQFAKDGVILYKAEQYQQAIDIWNKLRFSVFLDKC